MVTSAPFVYFSSRQDTRNIHDLLQPLPANHTTLGLGSQSTHTIHRPPPRPTLRRVEPGALGNHATVYFFSLDTPLNSSPFTSHTFLYVTAGPLPLAGPSVYKQRNSLEPACQPCRKAKVRCDASPPGSLRSRCRKRKTASQCIFLGCADDTAISRSLERARIVPPINNSRLAFYGAFACSRRKQVSRESKCLAPNAKNTKNTPKNTHFSIATKIPIF